MSISVYIFFCVLSAKYIYLRISIFNRSNFSLKIMYFSIPDLSEISSRENNHQQTYTLYHIHLNGQHFCSLRYSQLRKFHDDLQRFNYPTIVFPPKKIFNLSRRELDERRLSLERYLQSIIQNKSILSSNVFNKFFLHAQYEIIKSTIDSTKRIDLTIELLNHEELHLENLQPENSTNQIFDICLKRFQIDFTYQTYFSLFFFDKQDQQLNLIRPLFSFESPYFSLLQTQKLYPNSCLIFKKSYWDINYDLKLIDNQRTRRLLSIQTEFDIEQSKIYSSCSNEFLEQLKFYQEGNSFKEYILHAQTLKFYGYDLLENCSITINQNDKISSCLLAIGNYELNCYIIDSDRTIAKEFSFKVTRIRCWKVNWTKDDLNLAFEYLVRKDTLQWILIHSQQAPLISTCLQLMIDEILAKRTGFQHPVSMIVDIENQRTNISNGLIIRTQADLDRLNNNKIFDQGEGDDDL